MGIVRKLIIRILGTRSQRIHTEFGDVIIRTTKELEKADELIKDLLISWFVSLPWAYFEALFINDGSWNEPLLAALDDAQVIRGEDCALISQAFCLWHLEQIIKNDKKYNNYSMKLIEQWIKNQITRGSSVVEKLEKFRKSLQNLPPDDWYFEYIYEILNTLYPDHEKRSSIVKDIRINSQLRLALTMCSAEMIVSIKRDQT
jgi:hypothetical protein